ncbi:hypothetical protein BC938DRAFT_482031 [Jimgerdemannia flammicorona]|uniref:Uncharacterized protein n=1 Tax=Jimgerdemannia flammicorona TaxID=994334 RepID=A0A433QEU5_9FUNG|nr:hypothetical protein BC938DRAFT_482031 [Jimgerdemannia flammicorona]
MPITASAPKAPTKSHPSPASYFNLLFKNCATTTTTPMERRASLLSHQKQDPAISYKDLVKQATASAPKPYGAIPVPKSLHRRKLSKPAVDGSDAKTRTVAIKSARRAPIFAQDWDVDEKGSLGDDEDVSMPSTPCTLLSANLAVCCVGDPPSSAFAAEIIAFGTGYSRIFVRHFPTAMTSGIPALQYNNGVI